MAYAFDFHGPLFFMAALFLHQDTQNDCDEHEQNGQKQPSFRLRPYHAESTGSRPITEVKQRRARLVLGWVTAWEYRVP